MRSEGASLATIPLYAIESPPPEKGVRWHSRTMARLPERVRRKRLELLRFKVEEARARGDMLYAQAVCAAVANYEALEGDEGGAVYTEAVSSPRRSRRRPNPASTRPAAGATARRPAAGARVGTRRRPRRPRAVGRCQARPQRRRSPARLWDALAAGRSATRSARRAGPQAPAPVVRGARPGRDGLVRRLGARGLAHALAAGRAGPAPAARSGSRHASSGWPRRNGRRSGSPASAETLTTLLEQWSRRRSSRKRPRRPRTGSRWRGGSEWCRSRCCAGRAAQSRLRPRRFYARRRRRLTGYYRVDEGGLEERLRRWRHWLAQHGPMMLLVEIDRTMLDGPEV